MEKIQRELNYEGMVVVKAQGRSGGMALLWKQENQTTLLSFSNYHIDIKTKSFRVGRWRFTGFYGEPNRRKTWDLLRNFSRDSNLPWCVIGDLNNIVSQSDKRGGAPYPTWLVEGFNETLVDSGLVDMHIIVHQFTWERSRGSPSDHSPIYLDTRSNFSESKSERKFKFKNAWLAEPMCFQLVKDSWKVYASDNVRDKVLRCSHSLASWDSEVKGNFSGRIKKCKAELKNLRNKTDAESLEKFKEAKQKLFLILDQNEMFWRQRSKQLWLQAGDKNTRYFHAAASERRRSNAIQKLQNTEVLMVKKLFAEGIMLDGLNETNLVLISKKKNPSMVSDLRPISLCNVLIKIITKVMENRLKVLLDVVVSETQSAFTPGRLISDNILVSYEVMHYLKNRTYGKEGFMAIKLDMSKAYDRLEWVFMKDVLLRMGFCEH
ncbi:uncharacterized protein LOC141674128 [Apium graveolens]|uniref:uncharacterized protein LOC141674128 n=1 Tax=Apium graveolens TaxID=4045 RepID=UPI003D7A7114